MLAATAPTSAKGRALKITVMMLRIKSFIRHISFSKNTADIGKTVGNTFNPIEVDAANLRSVGYKGVYDPAKVVSGFTAASTHTYLFKEIGTSIEDSVVRMRGSDGNLPANRQTELDGIRTLSNNIFEARMVENAPDLNARVRLLTCRMARDADRTDQSRMDGQRNRC
jgi:hypothetical protein